MAGLNNGWGRRPGMGWEGDYDTFGPGRGDGNYIRAIGDSFVAKTIQLHFDREGNEVRPPRAVSLKDLGYFYVNPSSSWDAFTRDNATGQLQPDPEKYPHGIKVVADYVRSTDGCAFGCRWHQLFMWQQLACSPPPGTATHHRGGRFTRRAFHSASTVTVGHWTAINAPGSWGMKSKMPSTLPALVWTGSK